MTDSFKQSFMPAYVLASELRESYNLPSRVIKYALNLYQRLIEAGVTRGRSREPLIKACILISADAFEYPLITDWRVFNAKRLVSRALGLKYSCLPSPSYVLRLGSELGVPERDITRAIQLSEHQHGLIFACAALNKVGVSLRTLERVTGLSKNYVWRVSKLI